MFSLDVVSMYREMGVKIGANCKTQGVLKEKRQKMNDEMKDRYGFVR